MLGLTLNKEFFKTWLKPGEDSNLEPALIITEIAEVGAPSSIEANLIPEISFKLKFEFTTVAKFLVPFKFFFTTLSDLKADIIT